MMSVETVIERSGGVAALARKLGVSHVSVIRWRRAKRIPAERVRAVSEAAGVPKHEIRPDLFDAPAPAPQAAA
jgi:DNA-binding transcriptional regulator YdaS (Cro superfamily)